MQPARAPHVGSNQLVWLSLVLASLAGCARSGPSDSAIETGGSDGPPDAGAPVPRQDGDAGAGRDVFRFETFGNEGYWTDAVRLPAGVMAARVTPLKAMELGLQVDIDALDSPTGRR